MSKLTELEILQRMEKIVTGKGSLSKKQISELMTLAMALKRFTNSRRKESETLDKEKSSKTERLWIRTTPEGLEQVREVANDQGLTVSELIRERLPELLSA